MEMESNIKVSEKSRNLDKLNTNTSNIKDHSDTKLKNVHEFVSYHKGFFNNFVGIFSDYVKMEKILFTSIYFSVCSEDEQKEDKEECSETENGDAIKNISIDCHCKTKGTVKLFRFPKLKSSEKIGYIHKTQNDKKVHEVKYYIFFKENNVEAQENYNGSCKCYTNSNAISNNHNKKKNKDEQKLKNSSNETYGRKLFMSKIYNLKTIEKSENRLHIKYLVRENYFFDINDLNEHVCKTNITSENYSNSYELSYFLSDCQSYVLSTISIKLPQNTMQLPLFCKQITTKIDDELLKELSSNDFEMKFHNSNIIIKASCQKIMDCFTNFDKISGCELILDKEIKKDNMILNKPGDKFSLFYHGYNSELHFIVTEYKQSEDYWTRKAYLYKCIPDSIKFVQETKIIPIKDNLSIVEFNHTFDENIDSQMRNMFNQHKHAIFLAIKDFCENK